MVSRRETTIKKSLDSFPLFGSENIRPHDSNLQAITTIGKGINAFLHHNSDCQVGVNEKKMKNLATVIPREKPTREGTTETSDVKGKIVQFLWYMEKENKSKHSIVSYASYLGMLMKIGADLFNPESIKERVAEQKKWSENTKRMTIAVYKSFAIFNGIPFMLPKYSINQKLPFIPLESEIDALIVASTKRLATALQLL